MQNYHVQQKIELTHYNASESCKSMLIIILNWSFNKDQMENFKN